MVTSPSLLFPWNLLAANALQIGQARLQDWRGESALAGVVLDGCGAVSTAQLQAAVAICRETGRLAFARDVPGPLDADLHGYFVDELDGNAARLQSQGKLIAARCGRSQRRAIAAWTHGADLIVYGPFDELPGALRDESGELGLLHWWRETMTVPAAVEAAGAEQVEALLWSGADFIITTAGLVGPGDVPQPQAESLFRLVERYRI